MDEPVGGLGEAQDRELRDELVEAVEIFGGQGDVLFTPKDEGGDMNLRVRRIGSEGKIGRTDFRFEGCRNGWAEVAGAVVVEAAGESAGLGPGREVGGLVGLGERAGLQKRGKDHVDEESVVVCG